MCQSRLLGVALTAIIAGSANGSSPGDRFSRVAQHGDPRNIVCVGNSAVTADAIRRALRFDPVYQAAARPSAALETFLDTLRDRVVSGYQAAGFCHVSVTASFDEQAKRIVVTIEEGDSFRCGSIRVNDSTVLDSHQLEHALASTIRPRNWSYCRRTCNDESETVNLIAPSVDWKVGEPACIDPRYQAAIRRRFWYAYADAGFPMVKLACTSNIDVESREVHWQIEVEDAHPTMVGTVRVNGLSRHTEAQLLDYLKLESGMTFSADLMDLTYQRLRQSCRFWKYDVRAVLPPSDEVGKVEVGQGTLDVLIEVTEYTDIAKLDEPLSEVDQVLVRSAIWLESAIPPGADDDQDLVIECTGGLGRFRGGVVASLCPTSEAIIAVLGELDGVPICDLALMQRNGDSTLYSGRQSRRVRFSCAGGCLEIRLRPDEEDDDHSKVNLSLGYSLRCQPGANRDGSVAKACVEPVALVNLAHRPDHKTRIDDGRLYIIAHDLSLELEVETGALRQVTLTNESLPSECLVRLYRRKGTVAMAHSAYHDSDPCDMSELHLPPLEQMLLFAIAEFEAGKAFHVDDRPSKLIEWCHRFLAEYKSSCLYAESPVGLRAGLPCEQAEFRIPRRVSGGEDDGDGTNWTVILGLIDDCFPRGSWPWVISREWCFSAIAPQIPPVLVGRELEFESLEEVGDLGPLGWWCVRECSGNRSPDADTVRAARGLVSVLNNEIKRDLELLGNQELEIPRLLERLVEVIPILDVESNLPISRMVSKCYPSLQAFLEWIHSDPESVTQGRICGFVNETWQDQGREHMKKYFLGLNASARVRKDRMRKYQRHDSARSPQSFGECSVDSWTHGWADSFAPSEDAP